MEGAPCGKGAFCLTKAALFTCRKRSFFAPGRNVFCWRKEVPLTCEKGAFQIFD